MTIKPVFDEQSHKWALKRIEALWDAAPGSAEERELDALATLVDAYERKHFPILPPDPIAAIETRRAALGWTRKDLEPLIGSRGRVSEVLSGRRALSLEMIRRLSAEMLLPLEVLIAPPKGAAPTRKKAAKKRAKHAS